MLVRSGVPFVLTPSAPLRISLAKNELHGLFARELHARLCSTLRARVDISTLV